MCLAVPARIVSVEGDQAVADLDGVRLPISIALAPDLTPGDIALVHVGFALARIDPEEEARTLAALRSVEAAS